MPLSLSIGFSGQDYQNPILYYRILNQQNRSFIAWLEQIVTALRWDCQPLALFYLDLGFKFVESQNMERISPPETVAPAAFL